MSPSRIGLVWAFSFVTLEAIQYVYFGNVFQKVSSVLFGAVVFAITVMAFVGWSAVFRRDHLARAFAMPGPLIAVNVTATAAWLMLLLSVQMIEPAIAYTLGSGVMPIAAWAAYRLGWPEGEAMRNPLEAGGNIIILLAILYLSWITIAGQSGFVRGGWEYGLLGVILAIAEGSIFTWVLIYSQRLDRGGVGAGTVFGLRFPLYVISAAALAGMGFDQKAGIPWSEFAMVVVLGLALIIPPLYALQRALSTLSTLTVATITALGPFLIFTLQMTEGRVDYSTPTLIGLGIYFIGAIAAATGAVRASRQGPAG